MRERRRGRHSDQHAQTALLIDESVGGCHSFKAAMCVALAGGNGSDAGRALRPCIKP